MNEKETSTPMLLILDWLMFTAGKRRVRVGLDLPPITGLDDDGIQRLAHK